MKILMILGIVFAALLLIILVILMLPVKILVLSDDDKGVKFLYRILFFTFGKKPNPNSIIIRGAKQLTGISRLDSLSTLKKSVDASGVSATAGQVADILLLLAGRVIWLLRYLRVDRLCIKAVSAGDDAAATAMDYGMTCAVIYPLLGYLNANMKVNSGGLDVEIKCDFDTDEPVFRLDATVSVRIIRVVQALIYVIKKNVEKQVYIKEVVHE